MYKWWKTHFFYATQKHRFVYAKCPSKLSNFFWPCIIKGKWYIDHLRWHVSLVHPHTNAIYVHVIPTKLIFCVSHTLSHQSGIMCVWIKWCHETLSLIKIREFKIIKNCDKFPKIVKIGEFKIVKNTLAHKFSEPGQLQLLHGIATSGHRNHR